jgi:hypothetical protein
VHGNLQFFLVKNQFLPIVSRNQQGYRLKADRKSYVSSFSTTPDWSTIQVIFTRQVSGWIGYSIVSKTVPDLKKRQPCFFRFIPLTGHPGKRYFIK